MKNAIERTKSWLLQTEYGSVLGIFRIFFGVMMAYQSLFYWQSGLLTAGLTNPKLLFTYEGFEFLKALPLPIMQFLLILMGISALAVAAGWMFRWACGLHILIHLYFLILDRSIFNNHIYFFNLLGFLLMFTDADRFHSLTGNRGYGSRVPRWQLFILQAQIAILYIYGAVAKMSVDWFIHFEPLHSMLNAISEKNGAWAMFLKNNVPASFFAYGGFFYDLLVPFLLWWRKTRYWAILPTLFFHLSNTTIFTDIGIFPYFSIGCSIVFFWEINLLKKLKNNSTTLFQPFFRGFEKVLVAFFIFQLLFPLRWLILPNPVDYTMVGNRFSWRMKSQARIPTKIAFTIEDGTTGKVFEVKPETYLNTMQLLQLGMDARTPVIFAKFLAEEGIKNYNIRNPIVRADIRIRYNGRPEQPFIDPRVDLSKVEFSPFSKIYWTMPIADFPK